MNKKEKQTQKTKILAAVIKKWKLNQSVLSTTIGMNKETFCLKLNETNGLYRFTSEEYLNVCSAIDRLMAELKNFLDPLDNEDGDLM